MNVKGSEWRVLALVAVGMLLAEVGLRFGETSLSGDMAHLDQMETRVKDMLDGEGFRVLLVGNSLLLRGVDPDLLAARLTEEGDGPVSVGMVHPDGTTPLEWSYFLRKLVFNPSDTPDAMVLAFGPGHLSDRPASAALLRLAAHHVDGADVPGLLREELTDVESRSQFVLARASRVFALRDRIAPRVLDALVPRYRELAPILLRSPGRAASAGPSTPTFRYLERILEDAETAGVSVILIPMPAPEEYSVEAGALALASRFGVPVLDPSVDGRLDPARFPDGEHLDPLGMRLLTESLAPVLADALPAASR